MVSYYLNKPNCRLEWNCWGLLLCLIMKKEECKTTNVHIRTGLPSPAATNRQSKHQATPKWPKNDTRTHGSICDCYVQISSSLDA